MKNRYEFGKLLNAASKIVIIQADNPDGDSLGSALALEQIIDAMGKTPYLYCAVDMPDYLKHLQGWSRVSKELPTSFDLSIIVDTSSSTLLEKLEKSNYRRVLAAKPAIVLDHHADVKCDIKYATIVINDGSMSSTGELIYTLAKENNLPLNLAAKETLTISILADTMGLSNNSTTAQTYRVMAELVEGGVDRPKLEEARKLLNKMPVEIYRFKAELIKKTEFYDDSRIGLVVIGQDEINRYSPLYNPGPLMHNDILQVENVLVSLFLKTYSSKKITCAIRCAPGMGIADKLAKNFGGDGHKYSAGFKTETQSLSEVKKNVIDLASKLIREIQ